MERSTLTASVCCKTVLDFPPSPSVVVSCFLEDSDSSCRYPVEEPGSLLYSHHLPFCLHLYCLGEEGIRPMGELEHTMHPHTERDPRSHSVPPKIQTNPNPRAAVPPKPPVTHAKPHSVPHHLWWPLDRNKYLDNLFHRHQPAIS